MRIINRKTQCWPWILMQKKEVQLKLFLTWWPPFRSIKFSCLQTSQGSHWVPYDPQKPTTTTFRASYFNIQSLRMLLLLCWLNKSKDSQNPRGTVNLRILFSEKPGKNSIERNVKKRERQTDRQKEKGKKDWINVLTWLNLKVLCVQFVDIKWDRTWECLKHLAKVKLSYQFCCIAITLGLH